MWVIGRERVFGGAQRCRFDADEVAGFEVSAVGFSGVQIPHVVGGTRGYAGVVEQKALLAFGQGRAQEVTAVLGDELGPLPLGVEIHHRVLGACGQCGSTGQRAHGQGDVGAGHADRWREKRRQARGGLCRWILKFNSGFGVADVEFVVQHAKRASSGHLLRVGDQGHDAHGSTFACRQAQQIPAGLTLCIHTRAVNGVDFGHPALGQRIELVAGGLHHLVAHGQQAAHFAARHAHQHAG